MGDEGLTKEPAARATLGGLARTGLIAPAMEPRSPARHARVLVVDDEEDIRETLQTLLPRLLPGLEVATAGSASQALETLRGERFDLVMSDYRMPGMDGLELLREVHRRDPRMPLLLFTAYPEPRLAKEAQHLGIVFVAKPLASRELSRVVEQALAKRPGA